MFLHVKSIRQWCFGIYNPSCVQTQWRNRKCSAFFKMGKNEKSKMGKNGSHPHSDQCVVFLRCLPGLQHNLSKHSSGRVESSHLKNPNVSGALSSCLFKNTCKKCRHVGNFLRLKVEIRRRRNVLKKHVTSSNKTWTSSHMSTWTSRLYPNFWGENLAGNRRDTWKTKTALNVWHCYHYI